jgi:hypothetical protein
VAGAAPGAATPPRRRDPGRCARVPQLFVLEPAGPAGQRTKRPFFVPAGAGAEPCWYTPQALRERVQRTQGYYVNFV